MKKISPFQLLPILAFFVSILLFSSCKKNEAPNALDEAGTFESVEDDAVADFAYNNSTDEALDIAMEENNDLLGFESSSASYISPRLSGSMSARAQRCFTVSVDTTEVTTFPVTVTIDFGTGCTGRDGKLRKGKVITVYTGRLRVPGKSATTTFENYSIDTINVEGTHVISNVSRDQIPAYKREIINGKLTWSSGRWVKWSSVRVIAMIEGALTRFDWKDDVFRITGNGQGENSRGKTWQREITEGLIKKTTCRWISKGLIRFRHNSAIGSLNFGEEGKCDNVAILTVNGRSKEITLR